MPITTYTGTTEAAEVVLVENVDAYLFGYHYPAPSGVAIVATKPGKGTVPVRFPRLGAIAVPAGTLAETVDAVDVNVDLSENTITPARVAFTMPISDDLVMNQIGNGIPVVVLNDAIRAVYSRIHSDLLAASASSTSATGALADVFTLERYRSAKAAWRATEVQDDGAGVAMMLHGDTFQALEESAASSGSPFALRPQDSPLFAHTHGYQGTIGGFELFSSSQVAADSTGHSNWITPIGDMSGLGMVMSVLPKIVTHRGNDGERRATTYAHITTYFGVGIVNQTRFLEVLAD